MRRRRPRKAVFKVDILEAQCAALFRETWEARFGDQADAAWRALASQIRTNTEPAGYDPRTDWRTVLPSIEDEEDPRI
jgi:hypothetical protein